MQHKYLITKGEFWKVDEALAVAVGGVECQRLHHVVSLQPSLLHPLLHHLHSLHAGLRVKVTVDSNNLGT